MTTPAVWQSTEKNQAGMLTVDPVKNCLIVGDRSLALQLAIQASYMQHTDSVLVNTVVVATQEDVNHRIADSEMVLILAF